MPPLKAQLLLAESLAAYFPEMVFTDSGITVQIHRNTQLAPMLVTLAGVGIFPAQKRPPHTATDHMVVRRILQTDLT